jgi:hypothetical protein
VCRRCDRAAKRRTDPGADAVGRSGRQHVKDREREIRHDPARSKSKRMYTTNSARENREISWPLELQMGRASRKGKAKAAIPR